MMATTITLPTYPKSRKLPLSVSRYPKNRKLSLSASRCTRRRVGFVVIAAHFCKSYSTFSQKLYPPRCFLCVDQPYLVHNLKKMPWPIGSSVDDNGFDPSTSDSSNGRTRLVRVIQAFRTKLGARIKELRKDLPMKMLFFLVGFYCATAFSTVIGQTGDWDILSAALAVVVVEGIGALMYMASLRLLSKIRSLITMFNYWKAGLTLGLFLDSFKYEMDNIIASCNPFNFEIEILPSFW